MSAIIPNGLEFFLLGTWAPCTKKKYTEAGAKIALSMIKHKQKLKHHRHKRRESSYHFCKECQCYHLTSYKK